jgi:hypothetical protein
VRAFDQKVLTLYVHGLTVREMQTHLEECYAVPVSAVVITAVTDEVLQEVQAWQEASGADVCRGGLRCLTRENPRQGLMQHREFYLALRITASGSKDILHFWIAQSEGAAFWQRVMTELFRREPVGPTSSGDLSPLDTSLGVDRARVSARRPPLALLEECDRESAPHPSQVTQDPRSLSDGRCGEQTALSRAPERGGTPGPTARLAAGNATHHIPLLRRSRAGDGVITAHT